jgi:hypothetical protein
MTESEARTEIEIVREFNWHLSAAPTVSFPTSSPIAPCV